MLLVGIITWKFLKKLATRWLISARTISISGKIFLTAMMIRRQHGQAGYQTGPQGGRACRGPLPEPAPGTGDRPGVPGQRLLRRPGRGAGQVRDGAQGQGRRRPGHRGRRGVRVLPPRVLRRGRRTGILRAGRAGPRQARAARRQQAPRGDPRLGRGAAGRRPRAAPVSSGPRKIYRLRLADTTGDQLAQHRVQPAHGRAAAVAAAGTSLTGLYVVVVVAAEAAAQASSRSACTARARTRSSPSGSSAALIATAVCAALCGSTPIITAAMETLLPFRRAR